MPDETQRYLRAWHEAQPGATARAFAGGRITDGPSSGTSSYALLAARARGRVLDVGCGDGQMLDLVPGAIGVDLSLAELRQARVRTVLTARADALPLRSGSIDTVCSHMAFMLLTPIEAVVREIVRVLAPGGKLSCVIGGGPVEPPAAGDRFAAFVDELRPALAGVTMPALGDRRSRYQAGWQELFAPHGFQVEPFTRYVVDLSAPFDTVWQLLITMYGVELVAPQTLAELRAKLAPPSTNATVPCSMAIYLAEATRASPRLNVK